MGLWWEYIGTGMGMIYCFKLLNFIVRVDIRLFIGTMLGKSWECTRTVVGMVWE
ncbi:hypothetical protein KY313_00695 [Candidatus Woesearchaeota archaeon]|nr:hypothetical protein [Candidatus Woesearchaeota archaeon]